jgi:mannose-6-phosphate isomerase-like protein (cupin superfamily)
MTFEPFDPTSAPPDGRPAAKLRLFDAKADGAWRGHVLGDSLGTSVTVLAYGNDVIGQGPKLHVHPYDEVFVVLEGTATLYLGDPAKAVELPRGSVAVVEPGTAIQVANRGDEDMAIFILGAPPEQGGADYLPDAG